MFKNTLCLEKQKKSSQISVCANFIGYLQHIHNVNILMVTFLYIIRADVNFSILIRFIRYMYIYYAQFLNSLSYEN